jgi:hypothetical protein
MRTLLIVLGIAVVSLFLVLFGTIKNLRQEQELSTLLKTERDEYMQKTTTLSGQVVSQVQEIGSLKNLVESGALREDELRKLNLKYLDVLVKFKGINKIDSVLARFDRLPVFLDTVIVHDKDTFSFMRIPQGFSKIDDWVAIQGNVTRKGVLFDSICFKNDFTLGIGYEKPGFFKPLVPVVRIKSQSPYFDVTSMDNAIVRDKPPFYKRAWWHRLEGAAAVIGAGYAIKQLP